MIEVKHYGSGERVRSYACTPDREIELCFANIECLLNIALLDSDEHIKQMGGEQELLNLMNRYLELAIKLKAWETWNGVGDFTEDVDCESTECKDCTNHGYCDYEPQESEV